MTVITLNLFKGLANELKRITPEHLESSGREINERFNEAARIIQTAQKLGFSLSGNEHNLILSKYCSKIQAERLLRKHLTITQMQSLHFDEMSNELFGYEHGGD